MRYVRKNFNCILDGKGYAGQVEEFNAPKLALKTEAFQGGGMNGSVAITMGHEPIESDFTLLGYDMHALSKWGVREGGEVQFTAHELLESQDGSQTGAHYYMRGKVTELDQGTSKSGEKSTLKISLSLTYYKLVHGVNVVHEIDVPNMVHKTGGVDVLAAARAILGV